MTLLVRTPNQRDFLTSQNVYRFGHPFGRIWQRHREPKPERPLSTPFDTS